MSSQFCGSALGIDRVAAGHQLDLREGEKPSTFSSLGFRDRELDELKSLVPNTVLFLAHPRPSFLPSYTQICPKTTSQQKTRTLTAVCQCRPSSPNPSTPPPQGDHCRKSVFSDLFICSFITSSYSLSKYTFSVVLSLVKKHQAICNLLRFTFFIQHHTARSHPVVLCSWSSFIWKLCNTPSCT